MKLIPLARTGGLALAAVLIAANLSGSALAVETGTITGTITGVNGAPQPNAHIYAYPWDGGNYSGPATSGADGTYTITGAPAGAYRLEISYGDRPTQYVPHSYTSAGAQQVTVSSGAVSVVDDQLLDFPSFTGRLTDTDGTPLANTSLMLQGEWYGRNTYTNENGDYQAYVPPGNYKFNFVLNMGNPVESLVQYIPGADQFSEAVAYPAVEGQAYTLNETVMPNGYLEGIFLDQHGQPMSGVTAHPQRPGAYLGPAGQTDQNGHWRRRVKAGSYTVWFQGPTVSQYAFSQRDAQNADTVTVQSGQTTMVNDTQLATGSVRITARDARTGLPVRQFYAGLDPSLGLQDQNNDDGVATITQVPSGTYGLSLQAYGYHHKENAGTVVVTTGNQTNVEIILEPRTRIEATILNAQTGAPLAGVCLFAGTHERFVMDRDEACYQSGADGKTMYEIYEPGDYQLLALPIGEQANGFGAQWAGATSGKGSQLEAMSVPVANGQVASGPVVRMDPAGAITGRVTRANGTVPEFGMVGLVDNAEFWLGEVELDAEGDYTLDSLGPYSWPLKFSAWNEATQYSGGTGNRHEAHRIPVAAGATTTYNFKFRAGTTIDISVPFTTTGCQVHVVNAVTGDLLGGTSGEPCSAGPMRATTVDGQSVKLKLFYDNQPYTGYRTAWHGGTSFTNAAAVTITGPTTVTFDRHNLEVPRVVPVPTTVPTPVPVPRPTEIPPSLPPVPRP